MKKHLQVCAAREGITYTFNNGQIILFQDNFKYLGDVPFIVYFDSEKTTGNSAFYDPKMFVVSYGQIYSFHPVLNLDKIVIFWSFQQTSEEIHDLSHFKEENIPFFNKTPFFQLKDARSVLLAREKSTSLAEIFSVELKFTVDTLNDWFSNTIKPTFLELNDIKKQIFTMGNRAVCAKTICSISSFLLDVEEEGWYDFIVKREHLFFRNIYTP